MNRIEKHFDRVGRKQTLNSAIFWVAASSFLCACGIFQFMKYAKEGDPFYLYAGVLNVIIGLFGAWAGYQFIHAVVRRLVAQTREPKHLT